jgi:hypothetical protein
MAKRTNWIALWLIPVIAAVHFAVTTLTVFAASAAGYRRFDTGALPTASEQLTDGIATILMFPMYPVCERIGIARVAFLGWLPEVLNSLLWAVCLYLLLKLCIGRPARRGE